MFIVGVGLAVLPFYDEGRLDEAPIFKIFAAGVILSWAATQIVSAIAWLVRKAESKIRRRREALGLEAPDSLFARHSALDRVSRSSNPLGRRDRKALR